MNALFLVGRIIFGGYFLSAGVNHFKNLRSMSRIRQEQGRAGASRWPWEVPECCSSWAG